MSPLRLPVISPNAALLLSVLLFIVGVAIGTSLSLFIQCALIVAGVVFLKSRLVRKLELEGLLYFGVVQTFVIGILVGDVNYIFQTGGEDLRRTFSSIFSFFVVR